MTKKQSRERTPEHVITNPPFHINLHFATLEPYQEGDATPATLHRFRGRSRSLVPWRQGSFNSPPDKKQHTSKSVCDSLHSMDDTDQAWVHHAATILLPHSLALSNYDIKFETFNSRSNFSYVFLETSWLESYQPQMEYFCNCITLTATSIKSKFSLKISETIPIDRNWRTINSTVFPTSTIFRIFYWNQRSQPRCYRHQHRARTCHERLYQLQICYDQN